MAKPRYQQEPTELRTVVLEQGFVTPLQLSRIVAWKSAKSMANLTLNSEAEIKERTGSVIERARTWEGLDVLKCGAGWNWDSWREDSREMIGMDTRNARREVRGPEGLLALQGVGYPVASAILSIINPRVWPVIDKWSVMSVFGEGVRDKDAYYANQYEAFARHLATAGAVSWPDGATIHELDQAAMRASDPKSEESLPEDWVYASLV